MRSIIVDLDGTLASTLSVDGFTDRNGTVNWSTWIQSTASAPINVWCAELVRAMYNYGYAIIFLTAREGSAEGRNITERWLQQHGFFNYILLMRPEGDTRNDSIIKQELFLTKIQGFFDVVFALEDRGDVIDMWRSLNIPTLDVRPNL